MNTTSSNSFIDYLLYPAIVAGVTTAFGFVSWYGKSWVRAIQRRCKRHQTVRDTHKMDARIFQCLAELRVATGADRACLFQFQNGDHFSSLAAAWKVVLTHAVLGPGISPPNPHGNQLIPCGQLYHLLEPVFKQLADSRSTPAAADINSKIVACIRVDQMEPGTSRWELESSGVRHLIMAPIFRPLEIERGGICGFIKVSYCGEKAMSCPGPADPVQCSVCQRPTQVIHAARMVEQAMFSV